MQPKSLMAAGSTMHKLCDISVASSILLHSGQNTTEQRYAPETLCAGPAILVEIVLDDILQRLLVKGLKALLGLIISSLLPQKKTLVWKALADLSFSPQVATRGVKNVSAFTNDGRLCSVLKETSNGPTATQLCMSLRAWSRSSIWISSINRQ